MCGIAGIVSADAVRYRSQVEAMTDALRHRGPDGHGVHAFDRCILGHRRLTIVDLETGDQPMLSPDGRVAITFNGEIYGYRELRRPLENDYSFRTRSDTEVILALYEKHGTELPAHLPGMFAFALWDDRKKILLAARDRFGEKPLFYASGPSGEFLFASEIKAILASGLVRPVVDRDSLAYYLERLHVPVDRTIYENIHVLPPAHLLVLEVGQPRVERYWSLPEPGEPVGVDDAIESLRAKMARAVELQLVADVPVAAFVSGGLDSSTIVAVASRLKPGIRTISFGFRAAISELPYAREIAARYGTDHVELEDHAIDVADLLARMSEVYDEPFADSSNIPTWLISEAARKHAKVVLTGDGGDELLAGYAGWYRPLEILGSRWSRPRALALLGSLAARVKRRLGFVRPASSWENTAAVLAGSASSLLDAHRIQHRIFTPAQIRALGLEPGRCEGFMPASTGSIDDAFRDDLLNYMPGDILVKTDRASMAHGLELRAPFLDVELASFLIALPPSLKLRDGEDKWVLRRAFGDAWTESIRKRTKQGFGAPVEEWLRRPEVMPLVDRVLRDRKHPMYDLISWEGSRAFAESYDLRAWTLLVLGLWVERWL